MAYQDHNKVSSKRNCYVGVVLALIALVVARLLA
jgi:hypothetical protein